jgi:ribosomal protein S18 acetylase RimI-like enzyme
MDIRLASPADRDRVIALWTAAGLTRPWNDPGLDFDRALSGPSSVVLVGDADDELVAAAMVGHDGHRGWVYYVAVREDVRGRGYGTALMRAAEDWLRDRAIPKIQLMVRDDNAAAAGFYEALGYEPAEVRVLGRRL